MTQQRQFDSHDDAESLRKVSHYLRNGGHQRLQRLYGLPPHVYYNPFRFFSRENAAASTCSSASSSGLGGTADTPYGNNQHREKLSSVDMVRLLGLHVPGIDMEPVSRQANSQCKNIVSRFVVTGTESKFDISVSSDGNVVQEVIESIKFAAQHWCDRFTSSVTIRICIVWKDYDTNTLGSTASAMFVSGEVSDKLRSDSVYQPALAASIIGEDVVDSDSYHIHLSLNRNITWHFSRDSSAPSNKYDLSTIALHEFTHGLFFTGTIRAFGRGNAVFEDDAPSRFDRFIEVEGDIGVAQNCDGTGLYNAMRSPNLRFHAASSDINMGLYAPRVFDRGSSVYHFNNATITQDCRDNKIGVLQCSDLMTHELEQGYTRRNVGDTTMRVYSAVRSNGAGLTNVQNCSVPDYSVDDQPASDGFVLPAWGISFVVVVGAVGIILVLGVVVNTIVVRS